MANPLGDLGGASSLGGGLGKGFGSGLGGIGGLGGHHYLKWILILASIIGILSAILIFAQILNLNLGFKVPMSIETLGILAGICAFITGLDTIYNMIKHRGDSGGDLGGGLGSI